MISAIKTRWFSGAGLLMLMLGTGASAQSPIAYYSLDNHARDMSGNHNDGVFNGNIRPVMDRYGNACGALHFDGKSAYIEVPTSPSLESPRTAFTATCWYRFDQLNQNFWLTAVCKGTTTAESASNPQYRLQTQQNTSVAINTCSPSVPTTSSTISMCTGFTKCDADFGTHLFEGTGWNFYALVYDGRQVKVYMNGRKVFETDYSAGLQANNSPLFIGMDDPGKREYFEGSLDDVYLYNVALDEGEIAALYKTNASAVDWTKEEFQLSNIENKIVELPNNNCTAKVAFDAPQLISSSCGKVQIQQVYGLPSGSNFSVGKSLVTFQAVSESGYNQNVSFYIIVRDNLPPVLTLPRDTVILISKNQANVNYTYPLPMATDNCSVKEIRLKSGFSSGSTLAVGKHKITYSATDASNNYTEKEFTVEIKLKDEPQVVIAPPPKADTIKRIDTAALVKVERKEPQSDSGNAMIPKTGVPYRPHDLATRTKVELNTIVVEANVLKARVYDNAIYDGDTISLFLNNQAILVKKEVTIQGITFEIKLDSNLDNELTVYAENLGKIPPNTAVLVLEDKDKQYTINLSNTLKSNGIIRIRRKR